MAKRITNTNTSETLIHDSGKEVLLTGLGTYSNVSLNIQIKDGYGNWVTEPNNGTKTANFATVYTMPEQGGLKIDATSAEGATNVALSSAEIRR